jgi:hypothetical protein
MKSARQPKDAVLAAYDAANRGHFSRANAFLAPDVLKEMVRSHALTVRTGKQLRRTLLRLKGRRDEAASRSRKMVRALMKTNRTLATMRMGSPRFLSALWSSATRNRSLATIKVTRQVIQGSKARVHLKLTLRDGTVVRDSEPAVLRRGRWLLG